MRAPRVKESQAGGTAEHLPVKAAAILRWTGRGSVAALKDSVGYVLRIHGGNGKVAAVGGSLVVHASEPLEVAALVRLMPGISWIAVGLTARTRSDLAGASEALAKSYLRRGERFSVESEGDESTRASDLGGVVTSRVLDSVRGVRVSESPRARFRVAADGSGGVVGVEVSPGVGGVPTGTERAACFVSGGVHSSVCAWLAALAGFRVNMIHAKEDDGSVLAVARLYSELSHRMDPRALNLEILEGGAVSEMLTERATRLGGSAFGGFTPERGIPEGLLGVTRAPVYLLPEERFKGLFEPLGIRAAVAATDWLVSGKSAYSVRALSGGPFDVSGVLDRLR